MPEPEIILDAEFDTQLKGLFAQAEKAIESRTTGMTKPEGKSELSPEASPAATPETGGAPPIPTSAPAAPAAAAPDPKAGQMSLIQLLKPLVMGLDAVSRFTSENTAILKKLETSAEESAEAHKEFPGVLTELRAMLDVRNSVSQNMFAALHEELKGYKDGFLLDSVHRPIIRDLISLYDDMTEIRRQVVTTALDAGRCEDGAGLMEKLQTTAVNIDHNLEFVIEVLNRLEVTIMPPHSGKLDKALQRAIAVELAEDPDEDSDVVRSVKRGFMWKDRLFRAEEVVIKKWKEGFLVALAPSDHK